MQHGPWLGLIGGGATIITFLLKKIFTSCKFYYDDGVTEIACAHIS